MLLQNSDWTAYTVGGAKGTDLYEWSYLPQFVFTTLLLEKY